MKKKLLSVMTIVSLLMALCVCSMPVYAEETIRFQELKNCYSGADTYLYDEKNLLQPNSSSLMEHINQVSEETQLNIGVYVGHQNRDRAEAYSVAEQGAAMLDRTGRQKGSVFLYLDFDGDSDTNDYIYCSGKGKTAFADESSTNDAMTQVILISVRERIDQFYVQEESDIVNAGIVRFLNQVSQHYVPATTVVEISSADEGNKQVSASASAFIEGSVYCYDEAGLFNDAMKKQIISTFASTSDTIGFNLALYIGGISRSDYEIERMAKEGAMYLFGRQPYNGTVYLYIDFDGKKNAYDYIFAGNDAFLYYTNGDDGTEDRIDRILTAMERTFPAGGVTPDPAEIQKGLEEYCRQLIHYKQAGPVSDIYYTDPETGEYVYALFGNIIHSTWKPYRYWFWFLLLAIAAAIITGLSIRFGVKKHYQFKSSTSASAYTSKEKMQMVESEDIFLGTRVSKVYINRSSGSHGGGHGGGGHVGGGGGGHHR